MTTKIVDAADPSVSIEGPWLKLSKQFTDEVDHLAGRRQREDLVVAIAPGAGHGSRACFDPHHARIEIDGALMGDRDPAKLNLDYYNDREFIGDIYGLLVHEVSHARHTRWVAEAIRIAQAAASPQVRVSLMQDLTAAKILEEIRIEHLHIQRRPFERRWSRLAAAEHLMDEITPEGVTAAGSTFMAAQAYTLVVGRLIAGVLTENEVKPVMDAVVPVLGEQTVSDLADLCRAAMSAKDEDHDHMLDLGHRWRLLAGSDKPDGDSELAEQLAALAGALADKIVTDGGWAPGTGLSKDPVEPESWRKATAEEKEGARLLERRLLEYFIPERAITKQDNPLPPGRLNGRAALKAAAEESMGLVPSARPWRYPRRRTIQAPPLRAGLMVDVSGSQRGIAEASLQISWRMATAISALPDARFRAIVDGSVTSPMRSEPSQMAIYDYNQGTSNLHNGMMHLTERLALTRRGYARLLIVISDGEVSTQESAYSLQAQMRTLVHTGCRVLWLDSHASNPMAYLPAGVRYIPIPADPKRAADMASDELVKLMRND